MARRLRRVGRRVRQPVRRPAGAHRLPQLGQRQAARGDRVAGRGGGGVVPEHGPAVLRAEQPHRAGADRGRLRAAVGGRAGAQPLARRLLRAGAGPPRRLRAGVPQRPRQRGRRDRAGRAEHRRVRRRAAAEHPAQLRAAPVLGPALRTVVGRVRGDRRGHQHPRGQRPPRLRRPRSGPGDHAHRARVVRAPRGVAPDLRRRARTPPEPAHRAHRTGHGVDPAGSRRSTGSTGA